MTTMRAAVLHAVNDLRVEDLDIPVPGAGEVLVRVAVCGVCGSDATEYTRGPVLTIMPVTLGHEFAGTVEALGEGVTSLRTWRDRCLRRRRLLRSLQALS